MNNAVIPMSTRSQHGELWMSVLDALRIELGDERFERWVSKLTVLSESGDEIRLGVTNVLVLEWVERNYLPLIQDKVCEKHGGEASVTLAVDPALYRQHQMENGEMPGMEGGSRPSVSVGDRNEPPPAEPAARDPRSGRQDPSLESFVVGDSNVFAWNAAQQVLKSPGPLYNPLFLHGPAGVGKTHLLRGLLNAFSSRVRPVGPLEVGGRHVVGPSRKGSPFYRVSYLTGEQFFNQFVDGIQDGTVRLFRQRCRSTDILIVDDVHLLVNKKKTQIEFLHTFSSLVESGRQIILASDAPPKAMVEFEAGLVCRFLSGLVVGIRKPDYGTRLGIARAHASRFAIPLEESVLHFLAENVRAGAREIDGALLRLDLEARLGGGPVSLERANVVLAEFLRDERGRINLKKVHEAVSYHFGISEEVLVSRCRQRHVAFARQVAMYLGRKYTKTSRAEVGKYFGRRNPSTVKCAERRIEDLSKLTGGEFARELEAIQARLQE